MGTWFPLVSGADVSVLVELLVHDARAKQKSRIDVII